MKSFGSMVRAALGLFISGAAGAYAQSPQLYVVGPNYAALNSTPTIRLLGFDMADTTTQVCFSLPGAPAVSCQTLPSGASSTDITIAALPSATSGFGSLFVRRIGTSGTFNSNTRSFAWGPPISPAPAIANIVPTSYVSGSGFNPLTVNGSGFTTGSTINFGFTDGTFPYSFSTSTNPPNQVSTTLAPNELKVPGTRYVYVSTLSTFTYISGMVALQVNPPVISSLNPPSAAVGSGTFNLTLNGTFETPGSDSETPATVYFTPPGGTATVLTRVSNNATQMVVTVPASLLTLAGAASVQAIEDLNLGESFFSVPSNTVTFQIVPPTPILTSANPPLIPQNTQTQVTLSGTNLATLTAFTFTPPGGVATALTPSSATATTIVVTVPANLLASLGTGTFRATTASGTTTQNVSIVAPTLTSINPTTVLEGAIATSFTLVGTNFVAGNSAPAVRVTSPSVPGGVDLTPTGVTATGMTVSIPANVLTVGGAATVRVIFGSGAVVSNAVNLTILEPVIQNVNPNSALQGSQGINITLTGTNFLLGSPTVRFTPPGGSPTALTIVGNATATSITATVTSGLLTTSGNATITVQSGTAVSAPANFTIGSGPTLTSINPPGAVAGSPALNIVLTGNNFTAGGAPTVNILLAQQLTSLTVVTSSPTSITATIPANLLLSPATAFITVTTGTSSTAAQQFLISPAPVISFLDPSELFAGSGAQSAFVFGSNFTSGGNPTIRWTPAVGAPVILQPNPTPSDSFVEFTIPANLLTTAGIANVAVIKGGVASNSAQITIAPSPVITSLTPSFAPAGGPQFDLTIAGQNLISRNYQLVVNFAGSQLFPNSVTATQVVVTIPASLIAVAGPKTVTVEFVQFSDSAIASSRRSVRPTASRQLPQVGPVSNVLIFNAVGPLTLLSLNPTFVQQGSGNTQLVVTGNGFDAGSAVLLAGTALTTTFNSPTQLTATIPAAQLTTAGNRNVTVRDSFQRVSNAIALEVPAPIVLTSLSPTFRDAGSAGFTLTVIGSGFEATSVVAFGATNLSTQFISATQLQATVTSNLITNAGNVNVTVRDTRGRTSNAIAFPILGGLSITSINPSFVQAGSGNTQIVVTGAGYDSGSVVLFAGTQLATTFNSATQLTATVPANLIASAGNRDVIVRDSFGRTSAAATFPVLASIQITSLSPSFREVSSGAFTLTINGSGFEANSVATFNGTDLSTTFVSAAQVTAAVPANLIASVGNFGVTVRDGRGRISNSSPFSVVNSLQVTTTVPARANAGIAGFTIVVNGAGFTNGAVIRFNNANLTTTFVNPTTLTGVVPAQLLVAPGVVEVRVQLVDGRLSNPVNFTILPQLRITNLNPPGAPAGGNSVTVTITGEGFTNESVARFGGLSLSTTFVSDTQLTVVISDSILANPINPEITVLNPLNALSNALPFAVGNLSMTITSVNPNSAPLNGPATPIQVTGSGFSTATVIRFGNADLSTSFISPTQVNATIPAQLLTVAGNVNITAVAGAVTSNAVVFQVGNKPEITFLNPNAITAGAKGITLIVLGRGFAPGASIKFGDADLTTTFASSSQLSGVVPESLLNLARTVPVIVTNPDGQASVSVEFRILSLSLTSLSPDKAAAGSEGFTLTLEGTGFINGAIASFGSTGLITTFGSATRLTATVPSSALLTAGEIQVTVANPDGARSNSIRFTIESDTPSISRLNPASAVAGVGEVSVNVIGGGFVRGSSVSINGASVSTSFNSATSLDAVVPANLTANIGRLLFKVTNPGNKESNEVAFNVTAPTPVITSINPSGVNAGSTVDVTIQVTGTGFVNGSTVTFNGTSLETSFGSTTSLSAVIPVASLVTPGTANVQVTNPGNLLSNVVQFQIRGQLSVTAVSPSTIVSGGTTNITLGVAGVGFVNGATVNFNGNALATTFGSTTSLSAILPPALQATAGSFSVSVSNPGGAVSNSVSLQINAPIPPPALNLQVPAIITPAGNGRVQVTLDTPAPVNLQGTLVLTFTNNSNNAPNGYVDPALLFAGTGSRTINFTIPQGTNAAQLLADGAFSPGTVAGTIVVTMTSLTGGGQNLLPNPAPVRNIQIDRTVPVIVSGTVRIVAAAGGFQVVLSGISSPRDLVRIAYTFTATGVSILDGATTTVDVAQLFTTYFASDAGRAAGGAFSFTMPFTVTGGDANAVTQVSVTLTNSVGNSTVVTGGR